MRIAEEPQRAGSGLKRSVHFAFILIAALVVLSSAGFASLVACSPDEPAGLAFNRESWMAAPLGTDARYRMTGDLLKSRRLAGLKEAEVIELLGAPSSRTTGRLQYVLGGPRQPLGGFENILAVEFNADGTVARAFRFSD